MTFVSQLLTWMCCSKSAIRIRIPACSGNYTPSIWWDLGYPRHDVARVVGVSEGTVRNYLHAYAAGGLEALRQFNPHPTSAALDAYTDTIRQAFVEQPPHTVQEAVDRIEKVTGIRRSPTAVRTWLKKTGFGFRKTGPIPAKADPVAQRLFLETQLEPVLAQAQAGTRHVFFMDAAHFVLGAWLGYLWCLTRAFLPTPSGRQRFNVLGALHALTHEIITVTNETSIQ
ncbi:MAG: winged helix-turn-helix domain-containing protein [Firmicutes bacterium]|nr:winged helix-turn-helix domain-containing protein [Bacillota bacterium]